MEWKIKQVFINTMFFTLGFYDTSEEHVSALEPNYKKLRQEHMDEKRRDIQEEVSKIVYLIPFCEF